jgi:hypothetical protein
VRSGHLGCLQRRLGCFLSRRGFLLLWRAGERFWRWLTDPLRRRRGVATRSQCRADQDAHRRTEHLDLAGLALGLSFEEVRERFDEIVDFGIGEFASPPMRACSFSMGTRLRLSERGLARRRPVRGRGEMTASTESRRQDRVRWLAAATSQARCARRRLYDVDGAIDDPRQR